MTMHTYPRRGQATTCCGQTRDTLPLDAGMTTDPKGVTCDGTVVETVWAHEVYPHPSDGFEAGPLEDDVRYHLARAIAMVPEYDGGEFGRAYVERINVMLGERHIACLLVALHKGLTGQAAHDFAHQYSGDESGECIYDFAREYGVDLGRIKHYEVRD